MLFTDNRVLLVSILPLVSKERNQEKKRKRNRTTKIKTLCLQGAGALSNGFEIVNDQKDVFSQHVVLSFAS